MLSFSPPVPYPAQGSLVATGDFNNDGIPDLVVADLNSTTVVLGKGDGTFPPGHSYPAGGVTPTSLAVGDFNGDGNLDVVRANLGSGVTLQLGDGRGGLGPPSTVGFATGLNAGPSVAVGDFNGDGLLDLGVAECRPYWGYYGPSYVPFADVLLGDGHGGFAAPRSTQIAADANGWLPTPVIADFNGDGKPDFAVFEPVHGRVSVLPGDGLGNLQPPTAYPVGFSAGDGAPVAAGDVNGDGALDLVTCGEGVGSVLLGDGRGAFGAPRTFVSKGIPGGVALGDFNNDGKLDVATTDTGINGTTVVLLGRGDGTFAAPLLSATGSYPWGLAAGDFNRDGWVDLANSNGSVLLNTGEWRTFGVGGFPSPATAGQAHALTVTALDGNGHPLTGYTGTVHFTSSDAQAGLPADYTFTAADGGAHTFTVTLKTAGTRSVTVTDTGAPGLSGTQSGIVVNPAAASTLDVGGFPSPVTAGASGVFFVTARDAYGNVATGYAGTIHLTSSDRQAALPGDYTFTAADAGVHGFAATLKTAGTQSLTATDTVTAAVAGSQAGIMVRPAAASRFAVTAPSGVTAGSSFTLRVTALDLYGNVATGYTGTVHFTSSDGTATLPANYTFTAADNGAHTFTGLVLRKKGQQRITVTDTLNGSITAGVIENVL